MVLVSDYYSEFPDLTLDMPENHILVVEDDPFWQGVIRRNLEKAAEPCQILFTTNAEEALSMLTADNYFNLIVADQYLEGDKTGYDLWWDCKKRGIYTPFLLTSANLEFQDIPDLPVRFVAKPFVASELRSMMKELLQNGTTNTGISLLAWFREEVQRLRLPLLFYALSLIVMALYFQPPGPAAVDRLELTPPRTIAPPPPPPEERDPPPAFAYRREEIFTPQLEARMARIIERADLIISMAFLLRENSRLSILQDLTMERSPYGHLE